MTFEEWCERITHLLVDEHLLLPEPDAIFEVMLTSEAARWLYNNEYPPEDIINIVKLLLWVEVVHG